MNFSFNELSDKANQAFHKIVKKTNKVVENAKISYKVSELQDDLLQAYAELGKKVFENQCDLAELDIDDNKFIISQLLQKLDSEKSRLSTSKNKKTCPNCNTNIELDSEYCNKCGSKID